MIKWLETQEDIFHDEAPCHLRPLKAVKDENHILTQLSLIRSTEGEKRGKNI